LITNEIRQLSEELLQKLVTFQERSHLANPIKAKAHKRYVVGFKELMKHLLAKQLTLIVIAPDIEPKQCLDEMVLDVQKNADLLQVPVVYSLKRRKLGWILHKKVPVCAIGVFSFDGCGTIVEKLLNLVEIESENYKSQFF
jgi:selenocysteine insertion sequence-binding protein 2